MFSTEDGEKLLWNYCCHSDTLLKGSTIPDRKSCLPDIGKSQKRIKCGDYLPRLVGTFWKFEFTVNLFMLVLLKKYIINLHTNYTGQQPLLKFVSLYRVSNGFVTKCFNTGLNIFHGSVASLWSLDSRPIL